MLLVKLNFHIFLNLRPRTDGPTIAPPLPFNKNKTQQKYQRRFLSSRENVQTLIKTTKESNQL